MGNKDEGEMKVLLRLHKRLSVNFCSKKTTNKPKPFQLNSASCVRDFDCVICLDLSLGRVALKNIHFSSCETFFRDG